MTILALDTSTDVCSVALSYGNTVFSQFYEGDKKNTDVILDMIETVLSDAGAQKSEIELICFARGPGGFTGVRVATGLAQGMSFGLDIPVLPISTLMLMAMGAHKQHGAQQVTVINDARMNEVYSATYAFSNEAFGQKIKTVIEENIATPADVCLPEQSGYGVGSGIGAYDLESGLIEQGYALDLTLKPDARYLLELAQYSQFEHSAVTADQALPVYLRDNVAKKKAQR